MTTVPTSHHPLPRWVPAVTVAVLISVLIGVFVASGARLTWDRPTFTEQAETARPGITSVSVERAGQLAAARHELRVLQDVVRQVPSIRQSLHDRIQLLNAISAGLVPLQALSPRNDVEPRQANNAGRHISSGPYIGGILE